MHAYRKCIAWAVSTEQTHQWHCTDVHSVLGFEASEDFEASAIRHRGSSSADKRGGSGARRLKQQAEASTTPDQIPANKQTAKVCPALSSWALKLLPSLACLGKRAKSRPRSHYTWTDGRMDPPPIPWCVLVVIDASTFLMSNKSRSSVCTWLYQLRTQLVYRQTPHAKERPLDRSSSSYSFILEMHAIS
jgi:hypothetical protein